MVRVIRAAPSGVRVNVRHRVVEKKSNQKDVQQMIPIAYHIFQIEPIGSKRIGARLALWKLFGLGLVIVSKVAFLCSSEMAIDGRSYLVFQDEDTAVDSACVSIVTMASLTPVSTLTPRPLDSHSSYLTTPSIMELTLS